MLHTPSLLNQRSNGFTLIELMVTIAILAVLTVLAVPGFQAMIASSRLTTVSNDFLATLSQARTNAVRIGKRVTVCMSTNGTQCTTTGNWEQGWIVFIDTTRSGSSANVDTGETIESKGPALPTGMVMNGNLPYVSFAADGQPKTMTGGFLAGKIRLCSTSSSLTNDKRARDFVLNSAGRISISTPTNIAATCPAP